jgi:hypothetical protein
MGPRFYMFVGNIRIIDGSYVGQIPSEPFSSPHFDG